MKLITGTSGSGKTAYIYEKIKKDLSDGGEVLLIVPDREAVVAETELSEYLRDNASQRLDVYSFSRMCNDFFRKYGGLSYNYVDKTSANLLVFLALCNVAPSLEEYKDIKITDKDIITSLTSSIKQLKASGVTPSVLEQAIEKMKVDGDVAQKTVLRLEDILSVYSAREAILHMGYDDPDDDIGHMLSMLSTCPYFEGKSIYIDSFSGFSPTQYGVIRYMMRQAKELNVTLLLPSAVDSDCGDSVFSPTYDTYKRLTRYAHEENISCESTGLCTKNISSELSALNSCFTDKIKYDGENESVGVYEFCGIYDEIDAVCADISKKVRAGARFRDMSVILTDDAAYSDLLGQALESCGIKSYISDKGKLSEKPFIKFVFSALDACTSGFSAQSVISYVKTGLHRISDDTVFKFENYVKTWRISGKYFYSEPWTMSPSGYRGGFEDEGELLKELNEAKDILITPLYDLSCKLKAKGLKTSDFIKALYEFFAVTDVCNILTELEQKAIEYMGEKEGQEQRQVWELFFSSLSTLDKICGETELDARMFASLLGLVIGCVDIGTIPTSADAVYVGNINDLYGMNGKYVYILGAIEGKLPSAPPQGAFTQADMIALDSCGLQVGTPEEKHAQNSLFSFYKACTSARCELWISYHTSDIKGTACLPSSYLSCIFDAFPKLYDKKYSAPKGTELIYSKPKCLQYYAENKGTSQAEAAKKVLEDDIGYFSSTGYKVSNTDDTLMTESVGRMYKGDLMLSQSKIRSFTDCKFAYYCKYGLGLKERTDAKLGAGDIGTFIHYVLQNLLDDHIADKSGKIDPYTHEELCDRYMNRYVKEVLHIDGSVKGIGRIRALLARVKRNLIPTVEYVLGELASGDFVPMATEMKISAGGDIPPVRIKLEDGTCAYLTGIADRVDIFEKDGEKYIKLTDYKTGENSFSMEKLAEYEGIQLFMYMISICESSGERYKPAAVFYMSGAVKEEEVSYSTEEDPNEAAKNTISKSGAVLNDQSVIYALAHGDERYLRLPKTAREKKIAVVTNEEFEETFLQLKESFAALAGEMKSGAAQAQPKKNGQRSACTYCPYKFLCRRKRKS